MRSGPSTELDPDFGGHPDISGCVRLLDASCPHAGHIRIYPDAFRKVVPRWVGSLRLVAGGVSRAIRGGLLAVTLASSSAIAGPPPIPREEFVAPEPCENAITDPVATPLHEAGLDAQRSACLRDYFDVSTVAHALIDPDSFHGLLGGELAIGGRVSLRPHIDFGARIRVIDYAFAQTAVTKASRTEYGPLAFSVAYGNRLGERAAYVFAISAEMPLTRGDMETLHTAGAFDALASGAFGDGWRWHARLGTFAARARSAGGATSQLALRAGGDIVRRLGYTGAVSAGTEVQAGWYGGFDTLLIRAGAQKRWGNYRVSLGIGVPVGGSDHTTGLLTLGLARDL
jgi:hypothetical protein